MIIPSLSCSEWFGVAGRRARATALAAALLSSLAGCSISMPIPGFIDNSPTGSIKPKPAPNPFEPRDWSVVEPVLRTTMAAEPTADPASWANPETGGHGQLLAVAGTFKRDGASCRAFLARIADSGGERSLQGVGCAKDAGEVAIFDVAPWKGL